MAQEEKEASELALQSVLKNSRQIQTESLRLKTKQLAILTSIKSMQFRMVGNEETPLYAIFTINWGVSTVGDFNNALRSRIPADMSDIIAMIATADESGYKFEISTAT